MAIRTERATEAGAIRRLGESFGISLAAMNRSPRTVKVYLEALRLFASFLKSCGGKGFEDRRDLAIIRLLIDTGMRRQELTNLRTEDVDLRLRQAVVTGKGSRTRIVAFGHRTAQAIDRYVRVRDRHRLAYEPWLWLGLAGPMTDNGIAQIVRRRAKVAGIGERVNLHRFRHTFAHEWLAAGGQGEDLMALNGWRSRSMLSRYGQSAATERALAAHG